MRIEPDERGFKPILKQCPVQKVRFPADPPANCFLRTLPHKQPLSVAEVAANYQNGAEQLLEHDLSADGELTRTGEGIDTMRLRKNFTMSSYAHIFQPFDKDAPPSQCLADFEFARNDRHKPVSLLLRCYFLLTAIPADSDEAKATAHEQTQTFVPFERTRVAALYNALVPRNRRRKYYLKGIKRPCHLVVARTTLPIYAGASVPDNADLAKTARFSVAECPSECVALSALPLPTRADKAMWDGATPPKRQAVWEALGIDKTEYDETMHQEVDEDHLFYLPPEGSGRVIDEEAYLRFIANDEARFKDESLRTQRRAALLAVKNLLVLHEMCGVVYAYIMVRRRFSRMYMLGNERIAVEMTPEAAAQLVDMQTPPEQRAVVDWKRFFGDGDLFGRMPNDFALGTERYVNPPERFPEWPHDEDPLNPDEDMWKVLTIDHTTWQTHQDFLSAATLRLGSINTTTRPSRLTTPIQDEVTLGVRRVLEERLPPELVDYILNLPIIDASVCITRPSDGEAQSEPEFEAVLDLETDSYSSGSELGIEPAWGAQPGGEYTFSNNDWGPDWTDLQFRYLPQTEVDDEAESTRSAEADVYDSSYNLLTTPVHLDALAVTIQALASFVPTSKEEMDALVARQVQLDMARYN